ncbi:uncharacterized protein LOC142625429 [Castanea sativa]|uniref:uncharacterized protein LOC142625429 n=1 Tax=Castanea sativa TaxID=21020 RepID=UPI003F64E8FF
MFEPQLGKNIEVYINDMVVKSKVEFENVNDLGNFFEILRKHKLGLNAYKCSFGIGSGKFLGYIVTHRGFEVNPDQIKAINNLQPPRNPKKVQKLTGMTATLNQFISRSADRPKEEEVLFAYIAIAPHAMSLVLIRVANGVQRPFYYVSKSLHEAEVYYLPLEKAILAVVHATQKLPLNFQAHTIMVLTQLPIQLLLQKADYTRRIANWGTILGAFNIKYMPQTSIKGRVLAGLGAEFTKSPTEMEGEKQNLGGKPVESISLQGPLPWKLYVDGAANQKGSRVGLVVVSPEKITIEKSLRLGFSAINNEAKYEALLIRMAMVQKMGGKAIDVDDAKKINRLDVLDFKGLQIPKSKITHADSLATLAISSEQGLPWVILVEDSYKPVEAKKEKIQTHQIRVGPSWMDFIVLFLKEGTLPKEKGEANKVRRKALRFWLSEDQKLYKHSFSRPYLLCVHPEAVEPLLEELHEGICGSHTGSRSLSHKALTQGYWWSSMQRKAQEYVKKCDQCQRFAPNIHQPEGILNPLSSP